MDSNGMMKRAMVRVLAGGLAMLWLAGCGTTGKPGSENTGSAVTGAGGGTGKATVGKRPVVWYCLYYNAEGEARYHPETTYSEVIRRLKEVAEVRISKARPTDETLAGVDVVWISNPSDQAFFANPAPPHMNAADRDVLVRYVRNGGGLMVFGNQENHNLEIQDFNGLLQAFGMKFENRYTDAKRLVIPAQAPVLGGLRWAYYTGNQVVLDGASAAKPQVWIANDLAQKPAKGTRDTAGALAARAEVGKGRVVVVTDAGWVVNNSLFDVGVGDLVLKDHDNWEIFRRMVDWSAGKL